MKICVLIPAYNESKNIGHVVRGVRKKHMDVVVVDDGSKDTTGKIAREKGAVVLVNDPNQGKGRSLKRGFEYVIKCGFDGVLMMDGDGQHDVDDIDQFIDQARQHPVSIVTGNRMVNTVDMPRVRYCTNRFMSWLISTACRQDIPDTQCGYRYISSHILRQLHLTSGDFEIETEILMKASKKGFKIFSVPIKTIYRNEVSQIHPVKDTFRFIIYFVKELFSSGN